MLAVISPALLRAKATSLDHTIRVASLSFADVVVANASELEEERYAQVRATYYDSNHTTCTVSDMGLCASRTTVFSVETKMNSVSTPSVPYSNHSLSNSIYLPLSLSLSLPPSLNLYLYLALSLSIYAYVSLFLSLSLPFSFPPSVPPSLSSSNCPSFWRAK